MYCILGGRLPAAIVLIGGWPPPQTSFLVTWTYRISTYNYLMPNDSPHILLINPWIHDFAAYDFWAKPMGLLLIASLLKHHGISVSYIDCLDRFHPNAPKSNPAARQGRGPYLKTRLPRPAGCAAPFFPLRH